MGVLSSSSAVYAALSAKEKVMFSATVLVFCMMLSVLLRMHTAVTARQVRSVDYPYPQYGDLSMAVVWAAAIGAARVTLGRLLFTPLGSWFLGPRQRWSTDEFQLRVERFSVVLFKFLYFVGISVYGFLLMKDTDFLPWVLGGAGDTANCWHGYPFQPLVAGARYYYLVQLGYHLHSLAFHLAAPHRNDFLEMALHHICTVFLVVFSYMQNYSRIGMLVFFVHDVCDVFGYAIKSTVDSKHVVVTLSLYALLLVSWFAIRLVVFPFWVINSTIFEGPAIMEAAGEEYEGGVFFPALLVVLFGLHIFWFGLFIQMGLHFSSKGKTVDLQSKVKTGEEEGEEQDIVAIGDAGGVLIPSSTSAAAPAAAGRKSNITAR